MKLGQKVKGQGHRVTKCITSQRDSRAAPSRCGCVVEQRDDPARPSRRATTQPRRTVLFKAIEWSASVMHSIDAQPLAGFCFGYFFRYLGRTLTIYLNEWLNKMTITINTLRTGSARRAVSYNHYHSLCSLCLTVCQNFRSRWRWRTAGLYDISHLWPTNILLYM